MEPWLLLAAVPLLLLALLYRLLTRHFSFWKRLGVPYLKPTLLVGNMGGVVAGRQHLSEPFFECYQRSGDVPYVGMFGFDQPVLLVKDPELLGRILTTDFSSFQAHSYSPDEYSSSGFAKSLVAVVGQRWKLFRTAMQPSFTPKKLKQMFTPIRLTSETLVHLIEDKIGKGGPLEVRDMMERYTVQAAFAALLDAHVPSLQDDGDLTHRHLRGYLLDGSLAGAAFSLMFLAPNWVELFSYIFQSKRTDSYLRKKVVQIIEERRKTRICTNDLLDDLISINEDQNGNKDFDEGALITNTLTFLLASYDSTAATMTHMLYELALNQRLQERVREHIKEILAANKGEMSYETLCEMRLLHNTVCEAMRLHPPVGMIDRRTVTAYRIPGTDVIIPKGTAVFASTRGLHLDPRFWEEPLRYNPDRFSEEQNRPKYTFLPFGDGPRQCIGFRMGEMMMKIGLVAIIRNFRVTPTAATEVPLTIDCTRFVISPKNGLQLCFQKIHVGGPTLKTRRSYSNA